MTQPLNYCRAVLDFIREKAKNETSGWRSLAPVIQTAAKFCVPENGLIFDDRLRGLPEELHLPFDVVALEYDAPADELDPNVPMLDVQRGGVVQERYDCTNKRIALALEREPGVLIVGALREVKLAKYGRVWTYPPHFIKMYRLSDAEYAEALHLHKLITPDYWWTVPGVVVEPMVFTPAVAQHPEYASSTPEDALTTNHSAVRAVLELIEALSCSNVQLDTIAPRKPNKNAGRRGALPFDEYKVLVVNPHRESGPPRRLGGTHRSPREHLRRGHIRRWRGRKIWVNSCVVGAGAEGRIFKSYDTRSAA